MPTTDPNVAHATHTYAGIDFTVPHPYAAGHALTADESAFMNRVVAGAVGNAYGGAIRRTLGTIDAERKAAHAAKKLADDLYVTDEKTGKRTVKPATLADLRDEKGEPWDHAARFAALYADYQPGPAGRSSTSTSASTPLARLMRTLAAEDLKAGILARGLTVQSFMRAKVTVDGEEISDFERRIRHKLATNDEKYRSMAESQLAQLAAGAADDTFDDIELPDAA